MQLSHQVSNQMVVPGAPPTKSHLPNGVVGHSNSSTSGFANQIVHESQSSQLQSDNTAINNKQYQEQKKGLVNNNESYNVHYTQHQYNQHFNQQFPQPNPPHSYHPQHYQPPPVQQHHPQFTAQDRSHLSHQHHQLNALEQQKAKQQLFKRIQLVKMVGCLLNQMIKNCQYNMQRKQLEQKRRKSNCNLNDSQVTSSSGSVSWQREEDEDDQDEEQVNDSNNNQNYLQQQDHFIPFQSNIIPQISIIDYLLRIARYSECSACCFIMALIYIDRLTLKRPNFYLSAHNIHRLMLTSIMISAKFYDDIFYDNKYYARVGGITSPQINQLQILFLHQIGFDITVSQQMYQNYETNLQAHFANAYQQQKQQQQQQQQQYILQQQMQIQQQYQQSNQYQQQLQHQHDESDGDENDQKQQLKEPQQIIKNTSAHISFQKHPSTTQATNNPCLIEERGDHTH